MLTAAKPPTAICCFDYQTAILLIRCLVDLGLSPGKDLSVLGFDCPASVSFPRITSIAQPAAEMGALATALLLERIANPNAKPRSLRLSAQLIAGETTGPAIRPPVGRT